MSHKPPEKMNVLGVYNNKHAADKAMEKFEQCRKG
jgi:hypothetical protein